MALIFSPSTRACLAARDARLHPSVITATTVAFTSRRVAKGLQLLGSESRTFVVRAATNGKCLSDKGLRQRKKWEDFREPCNQANVSGGCICNRLGLHFRVHAKLELGGFLDGVTDLNGCAPALRTFVPR